MKQTTIAIISFATFLFAASCGSNSQQSASTNNITAVANVDSLNTLFRQDPVNFKKEFLNKPITLTGTINDNGEFSFILQKQTDSWGRESIKMYGAHTNLTAQDFKQAGALKAQPFLAFYDTEAKEFIEQKESGNNFSAYDYLQSIYQASTNSGASSLREGDFNPATGKTISIDEQKEANSTIANDKFKDLQRDFPAIAAKLSNGKISVLDVDADKDNPRRNITYQIIDEVAITGTLIDADTNSVGTMAFALKDAKVSNVKYLADLNKLPILSLNSTAKQSTPAMTNNAIGDYPQASQKAMTEDDLGGLTKDQLKLARNEIFARHGYIFKDKQLADYFSKQSWYKPENADISTLLTPIEKQNIALIKQHE